MVIVSCEQECTDTIVNTKYVCPDIDDMPEVNSTNNPYIAIIEYMPNTTDSIQKVKIKNFDFRKKSLANYSLGNTVFEHIKLNTLVNFDSLGYCEEYIFEFKGFLDFTEGQISFYDERNPNSTLLQRYNYGSIEKDQWVAVGE